MANHNPSSAAVVDNPTEAQQPIDILPDFLLARVFGYISLLERLKMSEVCRKWLSASRLSWLEIKRLDVSELPTLSIGTVLGHCSKLVKLIAHDSKVNLDNINDRLRDSNLRAIQFYNVQLAVGPDGANSATLPGAFSDAVTLFFRNARQLESFSWHNIRPTNFRYQHIHDRFLQIYRVLNDTSPWPGFQFQAGSNSTALTRFQLLATDCLEINASRLFSSLRSLTNLECLALGVHLLFNPVTDTRRTFSYAVSRLQKLRELIIVNLVVRGYDEGCIAPTVLEETYDLLPNLEVLALVREQCAAARFHGDRLDVFGGLARWIEAHPKLRILLIAANGYEVTSDISFAPRLAPNGAGFGFLPPLHIFIGGDVVRRLRFHQSAAAKIWPINERMPQFLQRPDVAEAFEGTWLAEIILEAAKYNTETWRYINFLANAVVYLP